MSGRQYSSGPSSSWAWNAAVLAKKVAIRVALPAPSTAVILSLVRTGLPSSHVRSPTRTKVTSSASSAARAMISASRARTEWQRAVREQPRATQASSLPS